MTDKKEQIVYTFQAPARIAFEAIVNPAAYQPRPGQEAGDKRYNATFLLAPDSPDFIALKGLVIAAAKAINPGKELRARRLTQEEMDNGGYAEVIVPWQKGDAVADQAKADNAAKKGGKDNRDYEHVRGFMLVKASSKYAPALSGIENKKLVEYTSPEARATLTKLFYRGAWAVPYVALNAYVGNSQKPGGVGLYLNAICFVKHDKPFGGAGMRVNAAEVFSQFAGTVSAADPTVDDEF